jgi:hypothetical protein
MVSFLINILLTNFSFQSSAGDVDSSPIVEENAPSLLCSSFCSGTGYDANSSTTFSSRANTPHSEILDNSGAENVF